MVKKQTDVLRNSDLVGLEMVGNWHKVKNTEEKGEFWNQIMGTKDWT